MQYPRGNHGTLGNAVCAILIFSRIRHLDSHNLSLSKRIFIPSFDVSLKSILK